MSLLFLVALAEPPDVASCRLAMTRYEGGLEQAAMLEGAFLALEDRGLTGPGTLLAAADLFDRQEQFAREMQTVLANVRQQCTTIEGFHEMDADLRELESRLRRVETDSRQMKLRLSGSREA